MLDESLTDQEFKDTIMAVELAPSTVDLDHLYAKKEELLPDNNVSLASVDVSIRIRQPRRR